METYSLGSSETLVSAFLAKFPGKADATGWNMTVKGQRCMWKASASSAGWLPPTVLLYSQIILPFLGCHRVSSSVGCDS